VEMKHSDFLRLLLKTGTGDMDLIREGFTTMEIKMWKKGTSPIPAKVGQYLLNRVSDGQK
tara:strand:+ start:13378 stop:13557 length:180 start_codon:yes stop_codon:yes gene_type:complete